MKLSTLIAADDTAVLSPEHGAVDIAGLTADSRKVEPGFLFAALAGSKADGGRFIADACEQRRRSGGRGRERPKCRAGFPCR